MMNKVCNREMFGVVSRVHIGCIHGNHQNHNYFANYYFNTFTLVPDKKKKKSFVENLVHLYCFPVLVCKLCQLYIKSLFFYSLERHL